VGENGISRFRFQILDLVFSETSRGAKMEICRAVGGSLAKVEYCQITKTGIQGGEESSYFETAEERNDRAAVNKIDGRELMFMSPSPGSSTNPFNP
jgi:hypothetical protein